MGYSYGYGFGYTWRGMKGRVTSVSVPAAPVNTGLPVITGTPTVGQTISTTDGTWTGSPSPSFTYQWKRAGGNIAGATANTYTLAPADTASLITVTVTATNASGNASATSASFGTINLTPSNAVAPVASGSLTVGSVLTSTTGTWAGTPVPTYGYQWKRDTTNVGTNASTYTLVTADIGAMMTCVVTGTNTAGSSSATSNALGPVVAAAVGGGTALLTGEANGFATDFLHATDAQRVSVKVAGTPTEYAVDLFYQNAACLSPKLVYDVSGALVWSPHNLTNRSQEMELSSWNYVNITLAGNNVAAPIGSSGMTADTVVPNAGLSVPNLGYNYPITLVNGQIYTYSVYAKNGTLGNNWLNLHPYMNSYYDAWFNLATGTKGTGSSAVAGNYINHTITSVGGGWYRLTITFKADGTDFYHVYNFVNADNTWAAITGDGVKSACVLWGSQLNYGAVATIYIPSPVNGPVCGCAIDYDPVTHVALGLLCEPQATNLLVYSSALASWGGGLYRVTVSSDAIAAPDGTTTADRLVETAATGTHEVDGGVSGGAGVYTYSTFAKAGGRDWFYITVYDGAEFKCYFNVTTGAVGNAGAGCTLTIQSVGNGWYRCTATRTMTSPSFFDLGLATANGTDSYLGDITKGMYFWGSQCEAGPVATSYIPTSSATVTRAGDMVRIAPAQINYSATAGSWWVDVDLKKRLVNDRVIAYYNAGSYITPISAQTDTAFTMADNIVTVVKNVASVLGPHKIACAFASADRALTADGLAVATDTTAGTVFLNAGTDIGFGNDAVSGTQMTGYIRKVRYVPRRKTGPELVAETT